MDSIATKMMAIIYLQIGTPKTGTTTLQRFLSKNKKTLSELNYLYPRSGQPAEYPIAHYRLANSIKTGGKQYNRQTGKWDFLNNEFSNLHREIAAEKSPNVILSCEVFSSIKPELIARLKQELSRYEVKILIYLREQSDFLKSLYIESIKHGYSMDFEEFIDRNYELGNYYNLLAPWSQLFGKENIIVKLFKKERPINFFFEDFLLSLGIKEFDKFNLDLEKQNVSPSNKTIKLIRHLNSMTIKKFSIPYHICKKIYIDRCLYHKGWQSLFQKIPNFILNEDLISSDFDSNELSKKFTEINRKVEVEYLQSEDERMFYED